MNLQQKLYDVVPEVSDKEILGVLQIEDFFLCFIGFLGLVVFKWKRAKNKKDLKGLTFNNKEFFIKKIDDFVWDFVGGFILLLILALGSNQLDQFFNIGILWSPAAPVICGLLGGILVEKFLIKKIDEDN